MKTILLLAAGVWIGREIFTTLYRNQAREREVKIRKKLEQFIREKLPSLSPNEMQNEIQSIIGQNQRPFNF